jgi:hypothetical protein
MSVSTAPCNCRIDKINGQTHLDSTECLLTPILDAFNRIQERAQEIVLNQRSPSSPPKPSAKRMKPLTHKDWKERWAPVQAALENLDRAFEASDIPRSPLRCGLCNEAIQEGVLHTFHGKCYEERFEANVDLTKVKLEVSKGFRPGDPARELALRLPDQVTKLELPGLAMALLYLLQDRS